MAGNESDNAAHRRRRRRLACVLFCGATAMTVAIVEIAGFHRRGVTMQALLVAGAVVACTLAAAWAAHKLGNVLLLFGAVGGTLLVSEVALRMTLMRQSRYDELFQYDARLGWSFAPGASAEVACPDYRAQVTINRKGFRGDDYDRPIAGSTPLIAVVGDSFTSNFGVAPSEMFTTLLDRYLGERGTVLNFGVNGYGQVQQLLMLDRILADYRPQWVLLVLYVRNDFDDNVGAMDEALGRFKRPRCRVTPEGTLEIISNVSPPAESLSLGQGSSLEALIRGMALHRLVRRAIEPRNLHQVPVHRQPPELRYCKRSPAARERHAIEATQLLLRELQSKCTDSGARMAVVVAPTLWQVYETRWNELLKRFDLDAQEYQRDRPQRLLAGACQQANIPFLDLLPALKEYADGGETLYYAWEQHWNARGNRRVAEVTAQWIEEKQLLAAVPADEAQHAP